IYTERGIMVGPSGRYSNFEEPDKLNGFFRSGYINDHGDRGVGISGLIPEHRAYAEWQHRQEIGDHLTLTASANWWKDSEVYRDFRSRDFFRVQEPDTFAEGVYTGENYFTSLFTRLQPNQFHRVQKRLPELRFDLLPAPIGHGFINRFNASAAMLREDQPFRSPFGPWAEVYRTVRLDAYYGIERPIVPRDWLAITPVAGGRITHYTDSRIDRTRLPDYTRTLGEVGADVVLRAAGTFDYKNPQWKIDGLRHLVTPRLGYRYIPRAEKGERQIIPIDRRATIDGYYEWSPLNYLPYLQPLGLGDMRNVDQLQSRNTLRVSLDNILQTRDTKEGTRDLVSLNVGTDFHFAQQRYQNNGTETHVEIALTPAPWLQFDAYQSYAPDSARTEEFNSGITLRDARAWSVRFSNNYLRGQIEDYMIDGRRRINERLEALVRLRYDTRKHRFNEQSYGIVQNLGNTWLVSYMVSVYEGRTRESSFGFNIQIDTVRF
ncbi:MAG: LPS assembly protein LptD, partial [Verrucomicrobiota bacterium]